MNFVIIGAQASGMTFAMRLKKNNPQAKIIIIDKNDYISFGACGLPYYVGDFFTQSQNMFARNIQDIEDDNLVFYPNHIVTQVDHTKQSITAENINSKEKIIVPYDKLLIASGSYSITMGLDLSKHERILTLKTLNDATKIKENLKNAKNIGIIGLGYIGLEMLESLTNRGYNITIFDSKDNITTNLLDVDFEDILLNEINNHKDMELKLNSTIESIKENAKHIVIKTTDNAEHIFDLVILATGFKPQTSFLGKEFNKLPNGALIVNQNGESNIKNIYACGDCACIYHKILQKNVYIPLATIANKMARKIADEICNIPNAWNGTIASSCLKLLNLEIAKTGICEFEAKQNNIPHETIFITDYNHTDYYPNQEKLHIKLVFNKQNGAIIGAQIVGKNGAVLRLHALSVAIEKHLSIQELSMLDFAYAPPFNRTWEALNIAGNVALSKIQKK